MPLMPGKSKKAFSKNVSTEMNAGKPQDQALAIAYSVKRKNKQKKAHGGEIHNTLKSIDKHLSKMSKSDGPEMHPLEWTKKAEGGEISANDEKRPMPDNEYFDREEASRNAHRRSNGQDGWTDQPTKEQALMNNGRAVKPIKHPKMAASDIVQSRLRDEEDDLQSSAGVNDGPQRQPPEHDNEEGPDRQGPSVPALKMKRMAEGGMINEEVPFSEAEEDHEQHPAGLESDNDQERPPEDEYMAGHFAEGGEVDAEEEEAIDHAASIAAAIMSKRRKMARGGEILSEDSMEASPEADQADLNRNAEEDANMEDKSSFDAIRKENYDEEDALNQADNPDDAAMNGHEEEDDHDRSLVGQIRSKMKKRSPITR